MSGNTPGEFRQWIVLQNRQETVELAFESRALRTISESESEAIRELGVEVAQTLKHRLADIDAAASIGDLLAGSPRISDDDNRYLVVDLIHGYRIVFQANHPNNPRTKAGNLDWTRVGRVKLVRIER